jgi:hypothetical protein
MASFSDDQASLKPNHRPQDGISRIQMWVGYTILSSVALVTGSIICYEHEHPNYRSEARTLAPVVPSLLTPAPVMVSTSKAKLVIPSINLGDYFYLHRFMSGISWNMSLKPAEASKAIAIPAPVALPPPPCKRKITEGKLRVLKNTAVLVEVASIVVCYFLWIGPQASLWIGPQAVRLTKLATAGSLLTNLATNSRLLVRVMSTVAIHIRTFKPFHKVWKGITTIYKNRSKLSVASEYTFYVDASTLSVEEEETNLESSSNDPTRSRNEKSNTPFQ